MSQKEQDILALLQSSKTRAKAFSDIVQMYQERLYWHIRKMVLSHEDADDLLQNTFMKAWRGLENFRGDSKISTWLYTIATNETLTFLANSRIRSLSGIEDLEDRLLSQLKADSYFDGSEAEMKLQEAILSLPEKQRLVFNMKYFDDMKYQEMEAILDTSVGALKASYHHAVKKIQAYLSEE